MSHSLHLDIETLEDIPGKGKQWVLLKSDIYLFNCHPIREYLQQATDVGVDYCPNDTNETTLQFLNDKDNCASFARALFGTDIEKMSTEVSDKILQNELIRERALDGDDDDEDFNTTRYIDEENDDLAMVQEALWGVWWIYRYLYEEKHEWVMPQFDSYVRFLWYITC